MAVSAGEAKSLDYKQMEVKLVTICWILWKKHLTKVKLNGGFSWRGKITGLQTNGSEIGHYLPNTVGKTSDMHHRLLADMHYRLLADMHYRLLADMHYRLLADMHYRLLADMHYRLLADMHYRLHTCTRSQLIKM